MPPYKFNPAALHWFAPQFIATSGTPYLVARRNNRTGNYGLGRTLYLAAPFGITAEPSLETLFELMAKTGQTYAPSFYAGDFQVFIKAQFEAFGTPTGDMGRLAKDADLEFRGQAARLFALLQPILPPDFKTRETMAPRHSISCSKRYEGVFVFPDWRCPNAVEVVVNVDDNCVYDVRKELEAWLHMEGLTLAPAVSL